ncbi:MAG TPA: aminotransferase class V-fold PLP-dependent enzyme [Actinocrinis sp.]|nr:aminotransferase class V-fold PLP-dependent enzyme [Actinocrinis sp.]
MTSTDSTTSTNAPADLQPLRDLWAFDPACTYLNHGGFGAVPREVSAHQQQWHDRREANPTHFYRHVLQSALEEARLVGAAFLGADPDGIAFVQNSTSGVGVVLGSFPFAPGDEILTTDHIYGAVSYAVQARARRSGLTIAQAAVPLNAAADEITALVLAAVTDRTRLVVLDQITSVTARRFPLDLLVPALQERGLPVLVDAAHVPGALGVDLTSLGPDFWVGNFHKWAGAPRGSAALYVAPRWRDQIEAIPVSWHAAAGFPRSFSDIGTADCTGWLATPAGLAFYQRHGWDRTRRTNAAMASYGQQVVAEAVDAGLADMPVEPDLPMRLVPLAGVPASQGAADELRDRLAREYGFETAINAWGGRTLLRLSAQLYNGMEDYEKLAAVLPGAIAAG